MTQDRWATLARLYELHKAARDSQIQNALEDAMDRELRAQALGRTRAGTTATALANHRRRNRQRLALETQVAPLMAGVADPWPEIDRRICIRQGLSRLHPTSRELLLMLAFGFSYAEVAEVQDTPVGTLKARVHRAKLLLAA